MLRIVFLFKYPKILVNTHTNITMVITFLATKLIESQRLVLVNIELVFHFAFHQGVTNLTKPI